MNKIEKLSKLHNFLLIAHDKLHEIMALRYARYYIFTPL